MRKLGPLLCLPVLLALFLLPAAAYSDLPQDHWAYSDLKRASELGFQRPDPRADRRLRVVRLDHHLSLRRPDRAATG